MTLVVEGIDRWDGPVSLRAGDEVECFALELTASQGVVKSIEVCDQSFCAWYKDRPLCWFGFKRDGYIGLVSDVWLLSSPAVDDYPVVFAKASKEIVELFARDRPVLRAQVHVAYAKARRWLDWLGFAEVGRRDDFIVVVRDGRR